MRKKSIINTILLFSIVGEVAGVKAESGDMNFHGTLIAPPPCSIDEGEQIDVAFGDRLGINKIDGVNFRVEVNYRIDCESGVGGWMPALTLSGIATDFDYNALATNKPDMGIRVYLNSTPFMPNTKVNFSMVNKPKLEAVPVKRPGIKLTEGAFEAWATLRVDYQ